MKGHKVDAIMRNERVSFCVVERDDVCPGEFTTYFRSVVLFGKTRILTEEAEKLAALSLLADKYSPGEPGKDVEIAKGFNHLLISQARSPLSWSGQETDGFKSMWDKRGNLTSP